MSSTLYEDKCFRPYFPSIREGAASLWAIEVWGFQDWNTGRALRLPATMGCLKTAMGVGKPNAWWIWWWMPLILTYWCLFLGWEARSTRSGYRRLSSGNLFIAMENGSLMLWLYVAEQDDFQSRARWSLHEQLAGQKPSGWPPDIPVMHQLTPLLAIFS